MNEIYNFGQFRLDLAERKLTHHGQPVPLTPKVLQTLEILLRHRDRIVSKQELLETVWPDCHVEDANLTQNISVLRKALGETNSGTKLIATFPKQGYRFIGDVRVDEAEVQPVPSIPQTRLPAYAGRTWMLGVLLLPIALLGLARLVRTAPTPPELGGRRALTHLPGREYQPALSPDGTRVAFVSHRDLDGPLRIGVLDLAQTSAARMISNEDGDSFSPAWSPDGRRLAYLHAHDNTVSIVLQAPESRPEILTEISPDSCGVVARRVDWSPDGRFLAVSTKRTSDEPFAIELIHIAEKRRTVLTTPPELSDGDFQPRFSPDGSKLAFVRVRSVASMEVLYVSIPGGDPVTVSDRNQPYGDIDWTPDSRFLLATPEQDGKSQLSRVSLAQNGKPLQWSPIGEAADGLLQFSVSRNTGRLVLAHAQPDQNIWRAKWNSGRGAVRWERLVASAADDSFPVYSPDGRRIAFLSDRSGEQQLWLKESDGRERQLTFGQLKPGVASWTADGKTLVFPSLHNRTLHRLAVDGGKPEVIAVGTVGAHTAVSPDGAWVYFVRRFYILRAPLSGGTPAQVTDQGGFPLRVSANGNWIYYVRDRYSSEIWRLRPSDGFTERVTDRLRAGCWACWSVSGDALVYIPRGEDDAAHLERLDLATRRIQDLGQLPGRVPPLGYGMLSLSPDGQSLAAVISEAGTGDIDVAERAVSGPVGSAFLPTRLD